MKINSIELYDIHIMSRCAGATVGKNDIGHIDVKKFKQWLKSEHKPICAVRIVIDAVVPKSVASHFRTHAHKLDFIETSRPDRTGKERDNKEVRYMIVCNPQTLINIARKRLCNKSEKQTIEFAKMIKQHLLKGGDYQQAVGEMLVPDCMYRRGCNEPKPCKEYNQ